MASDKELNEIKKLLKKGRIVVGTRNTIKQLREDKLEKIWLSSNVPSDVKEDIINYAKLAKVNVANLSISNEELGVICKKQFFVSVASVIKGEN
ncbi:MAG: ribosomal L7Ae/L30e/S12e/Gadd45 family protein [Nanoarchaeota archaeon]|nr:ribosomal L7Ae/L30e/S12e/Gadd45 family protein [Thermodesulfovibrionia bacterium]MCK5282942.1 ribosomal L7Ae/L30e/S12e/Gadd45 family protein [Nanoarchaeota archaeon]